MSDYVPRSFKETLFIILITGVLVGGTIWLLRWSFTMEYGKLLGLFSETELFGSQSEYGKRYKFSGRLTARKPYRLADGTGGLVWGYFNASADYSNFDGLVTESYFTSVSMAGDVYLQLADQELPLLFGEPVAVNTTTDDVYNDIKIFFAPEEEVTVPDIKVKEVKENEYSVNKNYLIAYKDFQYTYSPSQIKLANLDFKIKRKYLPAGSEVVVIGTYTPEGIKGTPEEPVYIFFGSEEECLEKLNKKASN